MQFLMSGSSEECIIETLHRGIASSSSEQSQLHPLVSINGSESTGEYKKVNQIPVTVLMIRIGASLVKCQAENVSSQPHNSV